MKYAGDTPAKKIARLVIWTRVKELLGSRFYAGTHVVLLSPWAGDVSTLLGLGVDPRKIVGVDIDHHAIAAAQHKFPGLRCMHMDVIEALDRLRLDKVKVVSVFLDFCAPFRDETVGKMAESASFLEPDGIVVLGAKMGREKGDWARSIAALKAQRATGNRTFHMRAEMLTRELLLLGKGKKRKVKPVDFYRYQSFRSLDRKSEMLICIAQLSTSKTLDVRPLAAARQIMRSVRTSMITANHRTVGAEASRLAKAGKRAHLLLNLKPESIPAYKAHLTRGSYEDVPLITRRRWA